MKEVEQADIRTRRAFLGLCFGLPALYMLRNQIKGAVEVTEAFVDGLYTTAEEAAIEELEKQIESGRLRIVDGEINIAVAEGNTPVNIRSAPLVSKESGIDNTGKILQKVKPGGEPLTIFAPIIVKGGLIGTDPNDKTWVAWRNDDEWNFLALTGTISESVNVRGGEALINFTSPNLSEHGLLIQQGDKVRPIAQQF